MNPAQERKAQALRAFQTRAKKNEVYVKSMSGLGKKNANKFIAVERKEKLTGCERRGSVPAKMASGPVPEDWLRTMWQSHWSGEGD